MCGFRWVQIIEEDVFLDVWRNRVIAITGRTIVITSGVRDIRDTKVLSRIIQHLKPNPNWNDMGDEQARNEYAENLVHLINDVRREFHVPGLPVVIGETGNMGKEAGQKMLEIRDAQAKAAAAITPEGSAAFVSTTDFARPKERSPNVGHGHHWFGNAESYFLIGDAMGNAMLQLLSSEQAQ